MPRLREDGLREIRHRIEEVAGKLFVENGYTATTTRQIATGAGLTPGALYVHYPGKEALFAAVVRRYNERFRDLSRSPLGKVLARGRFPFDLPDLAGAIRRLVRSHRRYWLLWYIDVLEFGGRHFRSRLAPDAVLGMPQLKARTGWLRRRKILRVDPQFAFRMVYMHLFNYFLVETIFRGRNHYGLPTKQAVDAMAAVFLKGILAPRGEEAAGKS